MHATLAVQGLQGEDLGTLTSQMVAAENQNHAIEAKLQYQTGDIGVGDGLAVFRMEEGWRWLGSEDASRVLTHWGNPVIQPPLGMVFPAENTATNGWGVLVRFEEDGWVEDDEADEIDCDALLAEMQANTLQESGDRVAAGYDSVALVGWADAPHYDANTHKLHWAKDLQFGGEDTRTLNYDLRALARRGVLTMNAVAGMRDLEAVRSRMAGLVDRVEFQEGHGYDDFGPGMDRIAAYGIGALIAGKLSAKKGLLKVLFGLLLAGKKFTVFAFVAVLAFGQRIFWFLFGQSSPVED